MARRLDKKLGDYLGIAISPVLIMTLVGSLIYFLLLVVYEGEYGGRLHFIFAMFVMGAVLIGRIAIEEGKERAHGFAAPLAVVTLLAINRFTDLGWIGSLLLIGLIWWCAHKLTWDCTLIDETEDASGEGLMQTIGLDERAAQTAPPDADQPETPEQPQEPEGVTSPAAESPDERPAPGNWWHRFVRRQRRPHAPGVWVVYFSLAALPLFGFGQLFIPGEDAESRAYAFLLLLVYVASGLGLLLATSFLGLRRYLRQRRIEMPASMAGLWVGIGCVLIVALLLFAMLLPRPGGASDVAALPFHVGSSRLGSSRHAMMKSDPAGEDRGGPRTGTREDDRNVPSGSQGAGDDRGSPGGSKSDEEGGAAGEEGEQGGSDQGSQSQQGSSSGSQEGRSDSPSRSESRQQSGSQSQGEEGPSDSGGEEGRSRADSPSRQERSRSSSEKGDRDSRSAADDDRSAREEQGRGAESQARSPNDEPGRRSRRDSQRADSARDGRRSRSAEADERRESGWESSSSGGWRESDRGGDEPRGPDSETTDDAADQGDRRPWFDPTALTSNAASWLGTLLKWVFFGGLLLAVGYWLWRSRAELLAALGNFLQELREFWQRLFGGRARAADQAAESSEGLQGPTPRPFADFDDPFASGVADRWSPDEVVRYTFAALEAWAREHGWPRGPDQTPHEFAHDLGTRVGAISQDARRLADLYGRVAYARESVPRRSVAPLKQLWRELRHREPVSV